MGKNLTPKQQETKNAAKARKAEAKKIIGTCEKKYTLMAGFDPNLATELVANLKEKGYTPTYVAESWLVFNDKDNTLTKEQVDEIREICANTKFEYKKTKKDKNGNIKETVIRTLKVLWLNAYRAFKYEDKTVKDTLNESKTVKTPRNRKPSANTTEAKKKAHNARKEANKARHPKGVQKIVNDARKRHYEKLQNRKGSHSSGTNRTSTQRKIAKRVALALKHIEAKAA